MHKHVDRSVHRHGHGHVDTLSCLQLAIHILNLGLYFAYLPEFEAAYVDIWEIFIVPIIVSTIHKFMMGVKWYTSYATADSSEDSVG